MSTVETSLYGVHPAQSAADKGYESPDEYADQGDTRVVRNLQFSYLAETKAPDGSQQLTPIDIKQDEEVTVDQIGLMALRRGEQYHEFYTTAELERRRNPLSAAAATGPFDASSAGEYELAEWLKTPQADTGKEPTINDVLEVVGDDKELAHRMLQAENIATDGEPRKGLETGLHSIIQS